MMVCRLKCVHSGFLLKRRCPLTFFQKNGVWCYGRNQSILVMSIYRIPVKQNDLALYLKKINSEEPYRENINLRKFLTQVLRIIQLRIFSSGFMAVILRIFLAE